MSFDKAGLLPFRSFVLTVLNAYSAAAAKLALWAQTLAAALRFISQRTVTKTPLFTPETQPYRCLGMYAFVLLCVFLAMPAASSAKEVINASYKYTLGDSDTKSDAKKIAFIEAKRLCLEKAGSYIESNTEVSEFRLTKDEIKTYTGGILKVEIVSEEFKAVGETLTLFMEVKAEVDLKEVRDNLKRVKEDKKFASKIKDQEKQLQALEDKIRNLQKQLLSNDFDKTTKIRKKRNETFKELDELEKIKNEIKSKAILAIEIIERLMTRQEVIKLLGYPRAVNNADYAAFNYGNVWISFDKAGLVSCLIKAEDYRIISYSSMNPCEYDEYKLKKIK